MVTPRVRFAALALAVVVMCPSLLTSEAPLTYRLSFPEPEHHWMAVEATLTELPPGPLELRMSRSSPGRYAIHDFAKNVYDVDVLAPGGQRLTVARPDPHGWTVTDHPATVTLRYKVFGDRIDGTYLSIDPTHAHVNMPAAIMWARGLDDRPFQLQFGLPAGASWQVATQLYAGAGPLAFTAPNLAYLMDSPAELGPLDVRQFTVDGHQFRFAAHHTGTAAELGPFVSDVERIVAAERAVFGEFPAYEPGGYTFIADYLPWANGDGMEHRNSTVITSSSAIRSNRAGLLDTVAHEFFHNWNVERIRPRSLEPFDFDGPNPSGELWLAEGFTQYYAPLSVSRAGVADLRHTLDELNDMLIVVLRSPGRQVRSVEEMSRLATFTDGRLPSDRTNWSNTYISYYPFGGTIALALDLTLRERFDGRVTLDDFMRRMWRVHGKPEAPRPGLVAHPYTSADVEERLAEVTGDPAFAREFLDRYVHGRDLPDFAALLAPAGLVLEPRHRGQAWWGELRLQVRDGLAITDAPPANSPIYKAGLDVGDQLRDVDGVRVAMPDDVSTILRRHRPGDTVAVQYVDRAGTPHTVPVTLEADPAVDLVTVESTGRPLTPAQAAFRAAWLGSKE